MSDPHRRDLRTDRDGAQLDFSGDMSYADYLHLDEVTGRYSLHPHILSLGYPVLSQLSIREIARRRISRSVELPAEHIPARICAFDHFITPYVDE